MAQFFDDRTPSNIIEERNILRMIRDEYASLGTAASPPEVNIERQLMNALKSNDFNTFSTIIMNNDHVNVNYVFNHPETKNLLDIACSKPGCVEFVKLLLDKGADVNRCNPNHQRSPIHFAIKTGDVKIIQALLERSELDINALCVANTALHLAIKHLDDVQEERENTIKKCEQIVLLLVKAGIDVDIPDNKNNTPIHSAVKQGLEDIVEIILVHSVKPVDIDSYKDIDGKSARDLINERFPRLLKSIDSNKIKYIEVIDEFKLFLYLNAHEEDKFISGLDKMKEKGIISTALGKHNGQFTMLQLSCSSGLDRAVKALLDNGAHPNSTAPGNKTTPIQLACKGGYYKILQHLVENGLTSLQPVNEESLLQTVIKQFKKDISTPNSDYEKCIEIIFNHDKTDINFQDMKKNTALHYAARSGNQEIVLKLLKKGASVGFKNEFDELALTDIWPKTLENYLDECLTTNKKRIMDEDFELIFDYSLLMPPLYKRQFDQTTDQTMLDFDIGEFSVPNDFRPSVSSMDSFLVPETDILLRMSQNEDLKLLLKHPVITSFIYMKWSRIRYFLYTNIAFYCIFWLYLMTYVLLDYRSTDNQEQPEEATKIRQQYGRYFGMSALAIMLMREFIQFIMFPGKYFRNFQNWIELCLIGITAAIISGNFLTECQQDQLAPVAILLSSLELIITTGDLPICSTYIQMLKTVSKNFLIILLWYCIPIVAFSLCFNRLFSETRCSTTNVTTEEGKNFFEQPAISIFKTFVMLTGELDASSMNFDNQPIISYVVFAIFVFLIPIVLLNLLNGLAVSDTQAIKANAELVGLISRIRLISYFEQITLEDTASYLKGKRNLWWRILGLRFIFLKPFARRVCLFPKIWSTCKIGVKINQSSKVKFYDNERFLYGTSKKLKMDAKIAKEAVVFLQEKKYNRDLESENFKKRVEQLESIQNLIYDSVKRIETNKTQ